MGAYLSSPVKTKETESNENDLLRFGATTMQGWRMQQEDAHNCILNYEENCSLFAVYDGHGGHEVSKYASNAFPEFLKATDMWGKGRVGEALEKSFLAFDEELTKPEVVEQLKLIAGTKNENEAEDDEDKELLYEEARLPLEEVLSKYGIKLRFEREPADVDCNDPKNPKLLSPFRLTACPTKNRRQKICVAKLTSGQGKTCQAPNRVKEIGLESPPLSPMDEKAEVKTDKCASIKDGDVVAGAAADISSSPPCDKKNATAACLKRDCNGKLKSKADKQQKQRSQKNHVDEESSDGPRITNNCKEPEQNLPAEGVSPKRCKKCRCRLSLSRNTASSQNAAAVADVDGLLMSIDGDVTNKSDVIVDNNDVIVDNNDVISKNANQQCMCRYDAASPPDMTNGHSDDTGCYEECDDHLPEPVRALDMPKDEEVQKKLSSIVVKNHSSDDRLKEKIAHSDDTHAATPLDSLDVLPSLDGEKVKKVVDTKIEPVQENEHAPMKTPELNDVNDFSAPAITAASTPNESVSKEPVFASSEAKAADDVSSPACGDEDEEAEDEEDEEYVAESGDDESSGDGEEDGSPDDDVVDENESDEDEVDPDDYPMPTCDTPGVSSGTTACVAVIKGDVLYVANAGDSRCVLCRGDRAVDLSEDHKPETSTEKERIERAGGKITEDGRVNGGLNLSRAIGDHFYKTNVSLPLKDQMISALPDIRVETLSPDDKFMVLACDGIWNSMSSQAVVDFVAPRLAKGIEPSKICDEICDGCLAESTVGDGTGCDNMTIIIVDFKRSPPSMTPALGDSAKAQPNEEDITAAAKKSEKTGVVELLSKSEQPATTAEI